MSDLYDGWPPLRVLVADPPWRHRDQLPGPKRGASKHYAKTMTTEEIVRMALPPLAEPAVLFLWCVASMPQDALDVVRWWGFVAKSEFCWVKLTKAGKPNTGMGWHARMGHERCIIATRGRGLSALRLSKAINSVIMAPIGEHSAKPDRFYEAVRALYPGPYGEMFGRTRREGWHQMGNELPAEEPPEEQPGGGVILDPAKRPAPPGVTFGKIQVTNEPACPRRQKKEKTRGKLTYDELELR